MPHVSRSPIPAFVLKEPRYAGASILVTGSHFDAALVVTTPLGTPSVRLSRPHGPFVRRDLPMQCFKNGMLAITFDPPIVRKMLDDIAAQPGYALTGISLTELPDTIGATWLDKQLVGGGRRLAAQGFGAQVRDAMHSRVDFLAEQGLAAREGQGVVLASDLLSTLRDRELTAVGKSLQVRFDRIYRGNVQLASGRFAMLDDDIGFSLVRWRPVIEQRLGQQVSAVVRGQSVTW